MKKFYALSILAAMLLFAACNHEVAPETPTVEEEVATKEEAREETPKEKREHARPERAEIG